MCDTGNLTPETLGDIQRVEIISESDARTSWFFCSVWFDGSESGREFAPDGSGTGKTISAALDDAVTDAMDNQG
jgi:hypothetical protein